MYVFNSGDITDNAETQIRHELPKELASNVRCFSGHHLEILAKGIAQRQDEDIRTRLLGLDHQLNLNIMFWSELKKGINPYVMEQSFDVRGAILHGLEDCLSRPIMPHRIDPHLVALIWQDAQNIRSLVMRHVFATIGITQELRTRDMTMLLSVCDRAIGNAARLNVQVGAALQELPMPTI